MDLVQLLDAAGALRDSETLEARLRPELWISWFDLERAELRLSRRYRDRLEAMFGP